MYPVFLMKEGFRCRRRSGLMINDDMILNSDDGSSSLISDFRIPGISRKMGLSKALKLSAVPFLKES